MAQLEEVRVVVNGTTYQLTDNGDGTWSGTFSAPTTSSWSQQDHKYGLEVTAEDTAGNSVTVDRDDFSSLALRVLEKTKPTISDVYPADQALIGNNTPTITWKVLDAGSGINQSTISLKLDGVTITSGITKTAISGGYSCSYTPTTALEDTTHTLVLDVSDNDGNAAVQYSESFEVDTAPPELNVTSPLDDSITNVASINVVGRASDRSGTTVTVKLNSGTPITVTLDAQGNFSQAVTLTEGANVIVITATDTLGRTTTVTRDVTLDTSVPTITNVVVTPNPADVGATVTITVTVSDN